jgi:hypothetical protein
MDRIELRKALSTLGVPPSIYSLGGGPVDERMCLEHRDKVWLVSFHERGAEQVLGSFDNESAACEFMLEALRQESPGGR